MIEDIVATVAAIGGNPVTMALVLIAATLIAEDAATIAAGLLAATMAVDAWLALTAVMLGTAIGDIGLYAAGRALTCAPAGRRLSKRRDIMRARSWLDRRLPHAVIAARVTPGLRFPVFLGGGLGRLPALKFAGVVIATVPPWTGLLFYVSWRAGDAGAATLGAWAGPAAFAAVACVILLARRTRAQANAGLAA